MSDHPTTWQWMEIDAGLKEGRPVSGYELRAASGTVYAKIRPTWNGFDWKAIAADGEWTEWRACVGQDLASMNAIYGATVSWYARHELPTFEICGVPIRFHVQLNPEGDRVDLCAWGPDEDVEADEPWIAASVDRETGIADDGGGDGVALAVSRCRGTNAGGNA